MITKNKKNKLTTKNKLRIKNKLKISKKSGSGYNPLNLFIQNKEHINNIYLYDGLENIDNLFNLFCKLENNENTQCRIDKYELYKNTILYEINEFKGGNKEKLPELILFILSLKLNRDNIIKILKSNNLYTSIYCLFGTDTELKNYQEQLLSYYNEIKNRYDEIKDRIKDKTDIYLIDLLNKIEILREKRLKSGYLYNESVRVYELKLLEKLFNYKETITQLFKLLIKDINYKDIRQIIYLEEYNKKDEKNLLWFIVVDKILVYINKLSILEIINITNYKDIDNTELDIRYYLTGIEGFNHKKIEIFKNTFLVELEKDNIDNCKKIYNNAKSQYLLNSIRNITGLDKLQEPYLEYSLDSYLNLSIPDKYPELNWNDTTPLLSLIDNLLEQHSLTKMIDYLNKWGILKNLTTQIKNMIKNIKLTLINLPCRIILLEQMFFNETTIQKLNNLDNITNITDYIIEFNNIVRDILESDIDINELRFINLKQLYQNDKHNIKSVVRDVYNLPEWLKEDNENIFDYVKNGNISPIILILLSIKLKKLPILYRNINLIPNGIKVHQIYPKLLILDIPNELKQKGGFIGPSFMKKKTQKIYNTMFKQKNNKTTTDILSKNTIKKTSSYDKYNRYYRYNIKNCNKKNRRIIYRKFF